MNRKTVPVLALSIILLFCLASCRTSVGALLRSNLTGLPVWYYTPDYGTGNGNMGLVGEGVAATERQARLVACSDIMDKLASILGYDLGQEAYRELTVLGVVSGLGLEIVETYSESHDVSCRVLLHVAVDRKLLDEATSDEAKERNELSGRIKDLVLAGDEFIKDGQELKAVRNYISAMALSCNLDYIDSEYSFDGLYPVVCDLISSMTLSVASERKGSADCTISLSRKLLFVSSAVTSAEILASFKAQDTRGMVYDDSFVCVTGQNGQFSFTPVNNGILRSGTIVFSLNLGDVMDSLRRISDDSRVDELQALIDSKSVMFSYSRSYRLGSIAVSVVEHDSLGYVTGVTRTTDYLTDRMKRDNAPATGFYAGFDNEEDILYELQQSGRTEECLLVIRVGVTGFQESRTGLVSAGAEGRATLYNARTSEILYESDIIYSNAFAETDEEAASGAFRNLVDIVYTLVKAVYV